MRAHATRTWTKATIALVALGLACLVLVGVVYAQHGRIGGRSSADGPGTPKLTLASKPAELKPAPKIELGELPIAVRTTTRVPVTIEFPKGTPSGEATVAIEFAEAPAPGSDDKPDRWQAVTRVRRPVDGSPVTMRVRFKDNGRTLVRARVQVDGYERATSAEVPMMVAGKKVVALTFDDGPSDSTTPLVLEALANNAARGTFFVSGKLANRHPKLVEREAAEGHEIMSHTMRHVDLTQLSDGELADELENGKKAISDILGYAPKGVRPPYGAVNDRVRAAVGDAGMMTVLWDVDTEDWRNQDASMIADSIARQTRDGAIVLMHDSGGQVKSTGAAVEGVIEQLKNDGYDFLTVSELEALGRQNADRLTGSSAEFGSDFSGQ